MRYWSLLWRQRRWQSSRLPSGFRAQGRSPVRVRKKSLSNQVVIRPIYSRVP